MASRIFCRYPLDVFDWCCRIFLFRFIFVCMCVYLCKYMPHVWGFPQSSEEDVGPLELELTELCELPHVGTGN